jgi:hypothetical protein
MQKFSLPSSARLFSLVVLGDEVTKMPYSQHLRKTAGWRKLFKSVITLTDLSYSCTEIHCNSNLHVFLLSLKAWSKQAFVSYLKWRIYAVRKRIRLLKHLFPKQCLFHSATQQYLTVIRTLLYFIFLHTFVNTSSCFILHFSLFLSYLLPYVLFFPYLLFDIFICFCLREGYL